MTVGTKMSSQQTAWKTVASRKKQLSILPRMEEGAKVQLFSANTSVVLSRSGTAG